MHSIVKQLVLNKGSLVNTTNQSSDKNDDVHSHTYNNLKDQILYHLVQIGDSLGGLAVKYETTAIALFTLNRFTSIHQSLQPNQVLMVIPHYKSLNMEPLKSLIFNLEIEKKSKQSQEAEPLSSLFGPHRSGFGYANWGSLDIGFEDPEDINYYQQKQEEYSAHSTVPNSIRCYLRMKSGFMMESFSFRKYQKVWCLLVDRHFLVFRNQLDQYPQRIVYLYGHCWKTMRTASSLCIAFEIPSGRTAKIFYKFENELDCKDWFELLQLLSHESIGPSTRDTTQIPFRDYFRDITTCSHQPNTVISIDATDLSKRQAEWNWMITNGSTGGMKYTGDIECDDAIDGLWNIDDGRIAHEENYEILRIILLRCYNLIAEDEILDCEKGDQSTVPSYANPSIKALLTNISSTPLWLDENLLKNGANLILSNIIWLFVAYLDRTLIEIFSSQEGISLWAAVTAGINMSKNTNDDESSQKNVESEEELIAKITLSSIEANIFLQKIYGILLKALLAASTGCLKPFSSVAIDFLDLRLELSLQRRKILSICGIGRWDESSFGIPFSQYFVGYCLGLFALHTIQILRSLRFGVLSDSDILSILHYWAYIGHLLGLESLYNPCLDKYTDFIQHMSREKKLHQNLNFSSSKEHETSESSSQFSSPHLHSNYFQLVVSILQTTGSSLLPSPSNINTHWSPSYHFNFMFLCFKFTSYSSLLSSIDMKYYSLSVILFLLFHLFWKNLIYIWKSFWKIPTTTHIELHINRLENILSLESSNGNESSTSSSSNHHLDRVSVRLWHDDERLKLTE